MMTEEDTNSIREYSEQEEAEEASLSYSVDHQQEQEEDSYGSCLSNEDYKE
jgi:hypothetical protein